jgi:methionine aminotransferase
MNTLALQSRLPSVGTTVFTTMSALASAHGAVNLGQGFPDFGCDPRLLDAVNDAMRAGHNQYPPMTGVPALREAISAKIAALYGRSYDAASEITVTAGATQALTTAILCCLHPGDEAIVIEPAYDSYAPAIALAGAVAVPLEMEVGENGYTLPWQRVAAAVTPRTRLIVINSPHNPTGSVLRHADLDQLAAIVAGTGILILSDEVYAIGKDN